MKDACGCGAGAKPEEALTIIKEIAASYADRPQMITDGSLASINKCQFILPYAEIDAVNPRHSTVTILCLNILKCLNGP